MADFDPSTARPITDQFDPETAKPYSGPGVIGRARDAAITAAKGVVAVPEALTGLADIASLGQAGKLVQDAGVDFKGAKGWLAEQYSPEQKAANAALSSAQGVGGTLQALAENPSTIAHGIIETLPSMGAGGAIARGAGLVSKVSPVIRGAIGEGAITAGQTAEQVRQETPGGTLTPEQAALAAASGGLTGALGAASGGVAQKLGLPNLETWMAGGGTGTARGRLARAGGAALTEGVLEEAPQSFQEQVAQNLATGKPWDEGAVEGAVQGGVLGAVMGGALGGISKGEKPKITPEDHAIEAALRAEKAAAAGKEVPEIKRLLGPGTTAFQMGEGNEPFDVSQQQARQSAVDRADQIYAERAAKEAELARFAANGPLSAAGATAMSNGAAEQATAKRMEAGEPADEPNTLPESIGEAGKARDANLAALLAQSPSMPLAQAQAAARMGAERGLKGSVVPHPSGGFTIAPTAFLSREAREKVAAIQRSQAALPGPDSPMPGRFTSGPDGVAPTTFAQNNPEQRNAFAEMRRQNDRPVPKQMPIDTFEAAKAKAARVTMATGVEYEVAPHPLSSTKFAIRPVAAPAQPSVPAAGPTQVGNEPTQTGAPTAQPEAVSAPASAPAAPADAQIGAADAQKLTAPASI